VYDADCGPCSKFRRLVDWLDRYNRLDYLSLVKADESGILDSIPRNRRHRSFHLISVEGKVSSGAVAIPNLLALLPLGSIAVALVHKVPWSQNAMNFVYNTLSRLHDNGSCGYKAGSTTSSSLIDRRRMDEVVAKKQTKWILNGDQIIGFLRSFL